ncbi:MAG: hypothetical protein IKT40_02285 [Bacilli bacterium]|nr:hypothetical protein [Bacilli bacterium]
MDRDVNIDILRKEAISVLNKAERFVSEGSLGKACLEYKQTVLRAEEIFHLTKSKTDKEFLLEAYMKMARYYTKVFNITYDRKDILPSCLYYEKVIYFYEEELKHNKDEIVTILSKMMEAYIQLLWVSLEIKDFRLFNKFFPRAFKHAVKLTTKSNTYEDEQYFILVCIFRGDFNKVNARFRAAYICYYRAMRLMKKIYDSMPQEGIKNDLILIYSHLSEVSKVLKLNKQKIKWDENIKILKTEGEVTEVA